MLDLYTEELAAAQSSLKPTQDVEPGIFANFVPGTGAVAMRLAAEAARAGSMALSVVPRAIDELTAFTMGTAPPFKRLEATERYFKFHDEVFGRAVDYWTPKPNEVGVAAEVAGSLLAMLPMVVASPALTVASQQLSSAENLVRKYPDVSAAQAQGVGAAQAIGLGLGIWAPILGNSLATRVLVGGALANTTQGVVTRLASAAVLGDSEAAKEYPSFGPKEMTLDWLLGMAFGAYSHVSPAQRAQGAAAWEQIARIMGNAKPSEIDALAVLRTAQHLNSDSLPGKPATDDAVRSHVDKLRAAIDSMARDHPVDVERPDVSRETSARDSQNQVDTTPAEPGGKIEPKFTPDPAKEAAAKEVADALVAEAPRIQAEEGLPPPRTAAAPRPPSDITGLDPEAQARAIGQHLQRRLVDTGMQTKEAVANASIWEAFARTAHARYGIEPAELMARWGVDVRKMARADMLAGAMEQPVYHGSPHDFDKFSLDKIGTGEGEQAYGHGLYFAENPKVAEGYSTALAGRVTRQLDVPEPTSQTERWAIGRVNDKLRYGKKTPEQAIKEVILEARNLRGANDPAYVAQESAIASYLEKLWDTKPGVREGNPKVYQVDIPDAAVARMLDWDKPLSEQAESVKRSIVDGMTRLLDETRAKFKERSNDADLAEMVARLRKLVESDSITGEQLYRQIGSIFGRAKNLKDDGWRSVVATINDTLSNERATSEYLNSIGIPGIKYLDAGSRNKPLRDVRREFLSELPEDAEFQDVVDLLGAGKFSPKNEQLIKALVADDWLGFDYPAQALSAALSPRLKVDFDPSPALLKAVSDAQEGGTRNLVVFDDKIITITHKNGEPVTQAERKQYLQDAAPTPDLKLTGETEAQIKAREAAAAAAPARGEQPQPKGKRVTADQADMFNTQGTLFQSQTQPFYSELSRQVDTLKLNTAPAKGWLDAIKGLVNKGVVKQAEIEATGLREWLDLMSEPKTIREKGFAIVEEYKQRDGSWKQTDDLGEYFKTEAEANNAITAEMRDSAVRNGKDDGFESRIVAKEVDGLDWGKRSVEKITKQQVQDFLAQNGVRVEEVELGTRVRPDALPDGLEVRRDDEGNWAVIDRNGVALGEGGTRGLAVNDALENIGKGEDTKFNRPDLLLPGGTNYRELLLRLPDLKTYNAEAQDWFGKPWAELTDSQKHAIMIQKSQQQFRSSHFDQPNILAHVRFNERVDADGKRVLFLEEIQSDWAQKGKREGFAIHKKLTDITRPEIEEMLIDLPPPTKSELKGNYQSDYKKDVDYIEELIQGARDGKLEGYARVDPASLVPDLLVENANWTEKAAKMLGSKLKAYGAIPGIPSGPFVGKTEAWVALAMKRMIRYAAENGFDRVAWTNGEQQAARYDLSKQVDRIEVSPGKADSKSVSVAVKGGTVVRFDVNDKAVVTESTLRSGFGDVVGKPLADVLGKDMADKIMQTERGTFEGEGLKVGGEGMRAFYDRIVPNVANDVLRKLGGGKVGDVVMNVPRGKPTHYADFAEYNSAPRERRVTQPGFDITPALREKAMAGLPLFQPGARGAVYFAIAKTIIGLFEKADKSTFQHESAHIFLEMTRYLATQPNAPLAAARDWATIAKWLKLEGGEITREQHEQWARGWEKYLAEGVAPNEGLKGAFKQFRDWLLDIYKSLAGIDSPINNEIRGVMARLLDSQAKDPIARGGLDDPRLKTPEYREALEMMGRESGWAEVGGRIIRDPLTGEVSDRTKWIAHAEWYQRMQQNENARLPGGRRGVERAVQKAIMGESMTAQERRAVTWMLDEHAMVLKHWEESGARAANPDGDPFEAANIRAAHGLDEAPNTVLDMALIDRAKELDADAVENIPNTYDDAQFMAAIKEIVDAKRTTAETDQGRGSDASGPQERAAPRQVAGGDRPPPAGAGNEAGSAARPDMLKNEAMRVADMHKDVRVRMGTAPDGTPMYASIRELLDEASLQRQLAEQDANLFTIAAECYLG